LIISYRYKVRPNQRQEEKMSHWLNMLRSSYNWCLRDRIDGWHQQLSMGDYCDLQTKSEASPLTCAVVKGTQLANPWKDGRGKAKKEGEKDKSPKRTPSLMQDANLQELKVARPWYQDIDIGVLQLIPSRVNEAFNKFFKGAGFPKFKRRHNFKSFSYKPGRVKVDGNKIYFPKIGWMRFYNSRPIPEGLAIKTVTIRQKADGWYVSLRLEDASVPTTPIRPDEEVKTFIGCDMGLGNLVYLSNNEVITNPRFSTNKKTRHLMRVRQRRVDRKKKGSRNKAKAQQKVNKLHSRIQQKREAYHWKVANHIVGKADAVVVEDLNIRGMMKRCKPVQSETGRFLKNGQSAKRGLNRSIADASWHGLIEKLEYLAAKSGKRLIKVNPKYTSQTCIKCGVIDAASRDDEKFICTSCGHCDDANLQAARNIRNKGMAGLAKTCSINLSERLLGNRLPRGERLVSRNPKRDIKSPIS